MQLWLTAAAAAAVDLFLSGACINYEFIAFFPKAKHLICVQPVWSFIILMYNIKKEWRLKTWVMFKLFLNIGPARMAAC